MLENLLTLDGNIVLFFQDVVRNPLLTPFFIFWTKLGDKGMIWILFTVILLLSKKTRNVGYMSACALLLSLLINNLLLKNLIARTRPYEALEGLTLLIPPPPDYSFPSGHTASSFAMAGVLYRKLPGKLGIAAVVLAFLIALSRLYLGAHYPSDILFGMFSGILISIVSSPAKIKTGTAILNQ